MSAYFDAVQRSMTWLGQQPDTIFIGQAVEVPGVFMHNTLRDVPMEKRLEFPVAESFQMQFSLGMALAGYTVISIFPRLNFLLLGLADLVNTIDKLPDFGPDYSFKLLIRTAVGPDKGITPGHQHVGDYSKAIAKMLKNTKVHIIETYEYSYSQYTQSGKTISVDNSIEQIYKNAYHDISNTSVLIEIGNKYSE